MTFLRMGKRFTQALGAVVLVASLFLPAPPPSGLTLASDPGVGPVQLKSGALVPPLG